MHVSKETVNRDQTFVYDYIDLLVFVDDDWNVVRDGGTLEYRAMALFSSGLPRFSTHEKFEDN